MRYRDALATFEALRDVTCGSEAIAGLAELRRREAIARNDVVPAPGRRGAPGPSAARERAGIGQRGAMVDSFEALARLAAAEGDPRRATTLLGFADALRAATSTTVAPALEDAHGVLPPRRPPGSTPSTPVPLWQDGRAMSVDQAVAYALTGSSRTPAA